MKRLAVAVTVFGVALVGCAPDPGTGTETTTTTTPPASGLFKFDFFDQSATVNQGCGNCVFVARTGTDGPGDALTASVDMTGSNTGYTWKARATFSRDGDAGPELCEVPVVQVRARANIGQGTSFSSTFRMDYDGTAARMPDIALGADWSPITGDYPTVYVESVTIDTTRESCRPVNF